MESLSIHQTVVSAGGRVCVSMAMDSALARSACFLVMTYSSVPWHSHLKESYSPLDGWRIDLLVAHPFLSSGIFRMRQ